MTATMNMEQKEEQKNRNRALLISSGVSTLIFLFLWLYTIVVPNPPFEFAGVGGIEVNFGTYDEGTGNVENTGIGSATEVVAKSNPETSAETNASKEDLYTSETGEDINVTKTDTKPKVENNVTVITPVKQTLTPPKENKPTNNLLNAAYSGAGKNGGGDGNSGHAGNDGRPDGNPLTHGLGGTGGGSDAGNGQGTRKILVPPQVFNDEKEEGLVVVLAKVDKNGNVIDADPNGPGTNTSSAVLKSKARQSVLTAKFAPSDKEIQIIAISIKFKF